MTSTIDAMQRADRVEDRIRLHRQVEAVPMLIVEGHDDEVTLKPHVHRVRLFSAGSRTRVIEALRVLDGWGLKGIRGLIDADFEDDVNAGLLPYNALVYEARDLESMLVSLGALSHVINHLGSSTKIDNAGGVEAVVGWIVSKLAPIEIVRGLNARLNWSLRFDAVALESKVDLRTVEINLERYVRAILQHSETDVTFVEVTDAMSSYERDDRGPRGKDMMTITGVALRRKFGGLSAANSDSEIVGRHLRSSAAFYLENSMWMRNLREALDAARAELIAVS